MIVITIVDSKTDNKLYNKELDGDINLPKGSSISINGQIYFIIDKSVDIINGVMHIEYFAEKV